MLTYILAKHHPLIVNHLLQCGSLVVEVLAHSLHCAIVYATHSYCVDIFILPSLFQPFGPVVLHSLLVFYIVVGSTLLGVPFPGIVAHHRFAVRRAYDNAAGVCRLICSGNEEERN